MASYVGIEMGGTKVVIATGTGPDDLSPLLKLPTRDPVTTLSDVVKSLRLIETKVSGFLGIGVASFGPIGVNIRNSDYGRFLKTPKPGWSHFDLLAGLREAFPRTPIIIDTDVNGAALAEKRWGGAKGLESFAYVTIGTGIGVGLFCGGKPVHGLLHPEAGHILIKRDTLRDPYEGHCPYHGDCLEGLACGPAIKTRTGQAGETISHSDPLWAMIGEYLAQLYYNLLLIASPQRILVGGGVGLSEPVLASARDHLHHLLGGYIEALSDRRALDNYITHANLGEKAGVLGAIAQVALVP
jgi:fructokinase